MQMTTGDISRIVKAELTRMLSAGCSFADARLYDEDSEEMLWLQDGNLDGNAAMRERGIGVRVLWRGAWGFAATADLGSVAECFQRALANSRAAALLPGFPRDMGRAPAFTGSYRSPVKEDPFEVSSQEKLNLLRRIDEQLKAGFVTHRSVGIRLQRRRIFYWNSEGTEVDRWQLNTFGSMLVMAADKTGRGQRRSHELFSDGTGTRGFEWLMQNEYFGRHAERLKQELSELLNAEPIPARNCTVILLPGQGWLQVHETIGHALELDRILGYELSFAGGSFVRPDMIGNFRYGSEKLNARAGIVPNSPGTFGFDDEGTPQRDYLLIEKGILVNVLSSRTDISEVNAKAGRTVVRESGTAARACAFYRTPIDRMTNINIDPGDDGTLEEIIAATEDGVIIDGAVAPSIGSNREHFHFGCEIAWEVKDGRKTRVLKNPTYQGHTVEFWNSLDMVGDKSTWQLQQLDNCGKGEPNQLMELGHGVPVLRFRNVAVGERE